MTIEQLLDEVRRTWKYDGELRAFYGYISAELITNILDGDRVGASTEGKECGC